MPGAREVLAWADQAGVQQFVYTHKETMHYLRDLGLEFYFTEILTSQVALRKPNSQAADYLLDKYQLDPEDLLYRGQDFGCGICPE